MRTRHDLGMRSPEEYLRDNPVSVAAARLPAADGGAPEAAGFYAWWLTKNVDLPVALPFAQGLLYVGIAPSNDGSAATIRSRVLQNHLGNAIGSSTFRRALTALLWQSQGWHPFMKGIKPAIRPDECQALTRWMDANLRVSWCPAEQPWRDEARLIEEMQPPLNSEHNAGHAFYESLSAARRELMVTARAAT